MIAPEEPALDGAIPLDCELPRRSAGRSGCQCTASRQKGISELHPTYNPSPNNQPSIRLRFLCYLLFKFSSVSSVFNFSAYVHHEFAGRFSRFQVPLRLCNFG
jgi:hypothetical protein